MGQINKAAVLGAGVMGATIAAHLANAGVPVLLLDIVPRDLSDEEQKNPMARNKMAISALAGMKKMKPAPFFLPDYASMVEVGNLDDDLAKLKKCDLVIEVVIERMDIKKSLFKDKVAPNLKKGAILATNTSGLSVNEMAEVLPPEVQKNFLVTHFFNPPRYMKLLEIVPCKHTSPEVVSQMSDFMSNRLGKGIVHAKDTTNFVGNRIGVYSMFNAMHHMLELEMSVEEVDAVGGPAIGRPKTAAFRTADLVGLDTLGHVAKNSYDNLPNDPERDMFQVPSFIQEMIDNGYLGDKTKQGFYKKTKGEGGKRVILHYDFKSKEYVESTRPKFESVTAAKEAGSLANRIKALLMGKDKAAQFAWANLRDSLLYSFNCIPEIADDIFNIDNGMKWGYNWKMGPFEIFDAIGVQDFVARAEKEGRTIPEKLKKIECFYKFADGVDQYYDLAEEKYKAVPTSPTNINLNILKKNGNIVEQNKDCSLVDLGDGVFCFEFHTKMNAIGPGILSMTKKAVKRAEEEGVGLVVGNHGSAFSAGANLMLMAAGIASGELDDVDSMIKAFQDATMALKYAKVPTVAAPHGLTLGGACEYSIHCDSIVASAETYMGLVEVGVGLIPGGGGVKEMAIRGILEAERSNNDVSNILFKYFEGIAMAKVSMSAMELYKMGYMRQGDTVTMNEDNLIYDAKQKVLALARNYRPSQPLTNLKAPGRSVAASIKAQLWNMKQGGFISEYDEFVSSQIADVITGGDVLTGTLITEEYLLQIERKAFMKLCQQKKTYERIQHMLKKGKPLRN